MFEFEIQSMTCGHCVGAVSAAIKRADPQAKVEIDLPSHRVRVQTNEDLATIESAVAEAGYAPS
jgi:copper chaperone